MHSLLQEIISDGYSHGDRTGVGRISIYNKFLEFDVSEYIPVSTTQKVFTQTAIKEVLWMLSGSSFIDDPGLEQNIWKQWVIFEPSDEVISLIHKLIDHTKYSKDEVEYHTQEYLKHKHNSIGFIYPSAWRRAPIGDSLSIRPYRTRDQLPSDFLKLYNSENNCSDEELSSRYWTRGYDQVNEVFLNLKARPHSSRHRVSAWIPQWLADEDKSIDYNIINNRGALTPCHSFFQFTVGKVSDITGKPTLNLFLYQGSCDVAVGGWYNILGYSILLHIFAHLLDMTPNKFSWGIGDAHVYSNQTDGLQELLSRPITDQTAKLLILGDHRDPFDFKPEDLQIKGYVPPPHIKFPVAK